jgi:hypothetical protein
MMLLPDLSLEDPDYALIRPSPFHQHSQVSLFYQHSQFSSKCGFLNLRGPFKGKPPATCCRCLRLCKSREEEISGSNDRSFDDDSDYSQVSRWHTYLPPICLCVAQSTERMNLMSDRMMRLTGDLTARLRCLVRCVAPTSSLVFWEYLSMFISDDFDLLRLKMKTGTRRCR